MRKIFPKLLASELIGGLIVLLLVPAIVTAGGLFYIDSTTGFAGFGNTNPQAQVDVSGAIYSRLVTATSSMINWGAGNVQETTLSSSPTLTFSDGQAGGQYTLILQQDGTGGRTVTWPVSVEWAGGTAPTLSTTPNAIDTATFVYDGTNYLGTFALDYGASSLLNDIVAYYKFDGDNSNDATSNGYNGTDSSMTYGSAYGKINDGASFNGSSSRISAPSGIYSIFDGTSPWTINLWVNFQAFDNSDYTKLFVSITNLSDSYQHEGVDVFRDPYTGDLGVQRCDGSSCDSIETATPINSSGWHMVTLTYDGSTLRGYLDGSASGTAASSTLTALTQGVGNVGSDANSGSYGSYFTGYMDEVGFWSRGLSAIEVSELYNGGSGLQYPF